jgi:hypothetical protein
MIQVPTNPDAAPANSPFQTLAFGFFSTQYCSQQNACQTPSAISFGMLFIAFYGEVDSE